MELELSYLLRRAEEERKAASEAATPVARKAHELLAAQYEARFNDARRSAKSQLRQQDQISSTSPD